MTSAAPPAPEVIDEHAASLHPAGRAGPAFLNLRGDGLRMAVVIAALWPVISADCARLHPEADLIRPRRSGMGGTADLLRAVSGPAGADAGQGRPQQGAGRWRRRRAAALGPRNVAVVPGAAARLARLAIDGPAFTSIFQGATRWQTTWRSPSPAICLAISGWRCLGREWSPSSRLVTCSASLCSPITLRRKSARSASIVMTVVRKSPDLGLRDRARAQRRAHPASKTLA